MSKNNQYFWFDWRFPKSTDQLFPSPDWMRNDKNILFLSYSVIKDISSKKICPGSRIYRIRVI